MDYVSMILIRELLALWLSVLGLDSGYTVKYTPLPSGVTLVLALGNSFRQRGIFTRISLLSSEYGYSTIQNSRVDSAVQSTGASALEFHAVAN